MFLAELIRFRKEKIRKSNMANILFRFCVVSYDILTLYFAYGLLKYTWKIFLIDYRDTEQIYDHKIRSFGSS